MGLLTVWKNKIYLATGDGRIEILAPFDKVQAVANSGDNSAAVEELRKNCDLSKFEDSQIAEQVKQYGIEIKGDETRGELESLLLWCLTWDYMEQESTADEK